MKKICWQLYKNLKQKFCDILREKYQEVKKMAGNVEYEQLLKSYSKIQKENKKLRKMLTQENISTLGVLVQECMKYNREQLKKIALELQLTEYDNENVENVIALMEFFKNVWEDLNSMTELEK